MINPLVSEIGTCLVEVGISGALLIRESYSPQSFGDAEVVYSIGNIRFRVLRDRGQDTVSLGSFMVPDRYYNIEDIAVWRGWINLSDLLGHDSSVDFDEPPEGPLFTPEKAAIMFAKDLEQIDKAFSSGEIMSSQAKLNDLERRRAAAI